MAEVNMRESRRRTFRTALISLLVALTLASCMHAPDSTVVYPRKAEPPAKVDFMAWLRDNVKPLTHERGTRWPMILWESVGTDPQSPEVYKDLLARGLTQAIRVTTNCIPTALALQAAGSPVIMMEGGGGPWPASLAGDSSIWAHQFEAGYDYKAGPDPDYVRPCLSILQGWAVNADRLRAILNAYRSAGIVVDAAWLDWEGDPCFARIQYEQASHCTRCRRELPAWVLASPENCRAYSWRLYYRLLDAYMAAPFAEIFPKCSTTNWMLVFSSLEHPVLHWNNAVIPPAFPTMVRATNPVAYGNTVYWRHWKPAWPLDRLHVDRFYMNLLLRQVSMDALNKQAHAPEMDSFPWVARWCPDVSDDTIPIISREMYRECLRHMWLRGVDGMQIFNATRPGYEDIVFAEVKDAVTIYDEMLEWRRFLDEGVPINFAVPAEQDEGVLWSGLRLGDEAVVRAISLNGGAQNVTCELWPGASVTLSATRAGSTTVIRNGGRARP